MQKLFTAVCMLALCCATQVSLAQESEELVTVTFTVPQDGVLDRKVSIEASGEDPERVFQPDADGVTYHLPKDREVWFEVSPDEASGYFVSQWIIDGSPFAYSSYLNSHAVTVYEGLRIEVEFERDDVFYTVEYTAPEGTMIRCVNRSESDPEKADVASGDQVLAASNVLFMISPEDNPDGKVNLKHWIINGNIYQDVMGDPITDNSIEFKLLHDLQVEAVVDDEVSVHTTDAPHISVVYDSDRRILHLRGLQPDAAVRLFDLNGRERMHAQATGESLALPTSHLPQGVYLIETEHRYVKVLLY